MTGYMRPIMTEHGLDQVENWTPLQQAVRETIAQFAWTRGDHWARIDRRYIQRLEDALVESLQESQP